MFLCQTLVLPLFKLLISVGPLATPTWLTILLILIYSLLAFISLLGNILIVIAIFTSPTLRTYSNMFLVNLATSDILLVTLATPPTLIQIFTKMWPLDPGWKKAETELCQAQLTRTG